MALYNGALVYIIQEDSEGARKNLETLWERDRSYRTYTALYPYYKNEDSEKKIQILLQVETESEEEKMALEEELLKIYLDDASHEKALPLLDSLYEQRISSHKERGGEYLFIKGDILMSLYRTEEGLSSLRQAFREGYHNRESIADLAGRLAPSTKHILLEWEKLYLDPVKTD